MPLSEAGRSALLALLQLHEKDLLDHLRKEDEDTCVEYMKKSDFVDLETMNAYDALDELKQTGVLESYLFFEKGLDCKSTDDETDILRRVETLILGVDADLATSLSDMSKNYDFGDHAKRWKEGSHIRIHLMTIKMALL